MFETGSADLKPEARKILDKFLAYLFGLPNKVVVEGHTDDRPISSRRFPSNWELSSARASAVARFFESEGLKGKRIRVIGYGQFRPRFSNATPPTTCIEPPHRRGDQASISMTSAHSTVCTRYRLRRESSLFPGF